MKKERPGVHKLMSGVTQQHRTAVNMHRLSVYKSLLYTSQAKILYFIQFKHFCCIPQE